MASLRAAQKAMTRNLLLASALALFQEQGYSPTTIDDIASRAGTTRVTFYAYFKSKGELMKALVDDQLNALLERVRSSEHGSTATALVLAVEDGSRDTLAAWLREASKHWPDIHPIIRIGREASAVDPELRGLVDRWMDEAVSDIEDGLNRAKRFPVRERHFRGVLAMAELDYVAQNWAESDWKIDEERMLATLADSWVHTIGRP